MTSSDGQVCLLLLVVRLVRLFLMLLKSIGKHLFKNTRTQITSLHDGQRSQ